MCVSVMGTHLLAGCLTSQQHASVPLGGVGRVDLLAGCLTSQQHASVSRGRICSDSCMVLQH